MIATRTTHADLEVRYLRARHAGAVASIDHLPLTDTLTVDGQIVAWAPKDAA